MLNYKKILDRKYPQYSYSIADEFDYDTLMWDDSNTIPKPTKEWFEQKYEKYLRIDTNIAIMHRVEEYPSIQDQLDILYHGGYDAWKTVIQAIKDKYPKPL